MTIMYGIPNCDTIKKARKWLEAEGVDYQFHDYRKQGIDDELVKEFCLSLGWENVLNKRGTTYRQLSQEQKDSLNEENAIALLVEQPSMIKRPIVRHNDKLELGFSAASYATAFSK